MLVSADGVIHQRAIPVEVVDTTAAGDAFAGGFAARLAEGAGLPDALEWAVAAGSLAVTALGAAPSIPRRTSLLMSGRTVWLRRSAAEGDRGPTFSPAALARAQRGELVDDVL